MKYLLFLPFYFLIFMQGSLAQMPVQWSFAFEDKGDMMDIIATANIQKKWSMYSQHTEDNGPIPTTFYVGDEQVVFIEKSKVLKEMDEIFEVQVMKFKEKAIFTYTIEKKNKKEITGVVNFMCCDQERCLPPVDVPFNYRW